MDEIKKGICKNPWCKATFEYKEDKRPDVCPKCKSFDSELSGGVSWNERKYDGPRMDGLPHQTSLNIKKYAR